MNRKMNRNIASTAPILSWIHVSNKNNSFGSLSAFNEDINSLWLYLLHLLVMRIENKTFRKRQHPGPTEIRKCEHWLSMAISNSDPLHGTLHVATKLLSLMRFPHMCWWVFFWVLLTLLAYSTIAIHSSTLSILNTHVDQHNTLNCQMVCFVNSSYLLLFKGLSWKGNVKLSHWKGLYDMYICLMAKAQT